MFNISNERQFAKLVNDLQNALESEEKTNS